MLGFYKDSGHWGFPVPDPLEEIYISQFDCPETAKYQDLLIGLINEITPCSFETVNGVKYIKYRLMDAGAAEGIFLGQYNKNLILLNFIRNLWHEPPSGGGLKAGYLARFFTALAKSDEKYKDPLQRLTWANKEACEFNKTPYKYSPGHSNVHESHTLKIKTTAQLMAFKCNSTGEFLIGG
jgi:hypothetical protein